MNNFPMADEREEESRKNEHIVGRILKKKNGGYFFNVVSKKKKGWGPNPTGTQHTWHPTALFCGCFVLIWF